MRALGTTGWMILSLALATAATAAPVLSPVTGSYYDYINRDIGDRDYTTWTWEQAKADAAARTYMGRRGHLVTLTSKAEETVLIDNWLGDILYGQPWLGGFRAPGSDFLTGWQWVTGEPFVYTNWGLGEPNNAGDETFLHYQSIGVQDVDTYERYGWNDASNQTRGTASYFIEYSPVPEPGSLALLGLGLAALGFVRRRKD